MFIWNDNGKYKYYCYKQKVSTFFLYLDNTDDFRLIQKTKWILKTILKITFCGFSLIFLIFFGLNN